MPMAVRCAPGMECGRYPSASIFWQTARTCASVACACMTTNMTPPREIQVYRRRRIHRKPGLLAVRRPAPDLDGSLYFLHGPFHCPRAGHFQTVGAEAPASFEL